MTNVDIIVYGLGTLGLIYCLTMMIYYSSRNKRDNEFITKCMRNYTTWDIKTNYVYPLAEVRKGFDDVGNYDIDIRVHDLEGNYLYSYPKTKK